MSVLAEAVKDYCVWPVFVFVSQSSFAFASVHSLLKVKNAE